MQEGPVCPIPLSHNTRIVLGHGSGGKMSQELIQGLFLPPFANPALLAGDDAAVVHPNTSTRIAISTDSHVVWPLFFPGGDIGRLSVCGTVNDLAMMGACPLYLTAGFILEEGLEVEVLERVVASMQAAAQEACVEIVAGDTKVVQKGKADLLYINTSGVGLVDARTQISGHRAQPGDVVIVSGDVGDHGIAVLAARGELGLEIDIASDVSPLNAMVASLLEAVPDVHVLRDPTRGGVATSLNEIAKQSKVNIFLEEGLIPVKPAVSAACEVLGFDPLYVANEGKLLAFVPKKDADAALEAIHSSPYGRNAAVIGVVREAPTGRVLMKTNLGTTRVVDVLAGEMLPRIC